MIAYRIYSHLSREILDNFYEVFFQFDLYTGQLINKYIVFKSWPFLTLFLLIYVHQDYSCCVNWNVILIRFNLMCLQILYALHSPLVLRQHQPAGVKSTKLCFYYFQIFCSDQTRFDWQGRDRGAASKDLQGTGWGCPGVQPDPDQQPLLQGWSLIQSLLTSRINLLSCLFVHKKLNVHSFVHLINLWHQRFL